MVAAIFAATAGGNSNGCIVAMMRICDVTAASPVISVIDFERRVPEVRGAPEAAPFGHREDVAEASLLREFAICRFSSKLGGYCGAVSDIRKPLFPMGRNTPSSSRPSSVMDVRSAYFRLGTGGTGARRTATNIGTRYASASSRSSGR